MQHETVAEKVQVSRHVCIVRSKVTESKNVESNEILIVVRLKIKTSKE
jgi:hypothetical protein